MQRRQSRPHHRGRPNLSNCELATDIERSPKRSSSIARLPESPDAWLTGRRDDEALSGRPRRRLFAMTTPHSKVLNTMQPSITRFGFFTKSDGNTMDAMKAVATTSSDRASSESFHSLCRDRRFVRARPALSRA